jgi:hypothetical protein
MVFTWGSRIEEIRMNRWTLIDCMPMVAKEEELPRITIGSEEQLRDELLSYCQRKPASIIELVSPEGDILHMGLGREFSGVQWIREPLNLAKRQMKIAVADRVYTEVGVEFRFQGSVSGFRPKYVIPVEKAIDAAVHFFKMGQLPDWLQWADWDNKTRKLAVPDLSPAAVQGDIH